MKKRISLTADTQLYRRIVRQLACSSICPRVICSCFSLHLSSFLQFPTSDYVWWGKKSKLVFNFLTYSRETWLSFSYGIVGNLFRLIEPSNEIDRVSKFDNSLSFGAKQNALRQISFELWFFKDFFTKNSNWIFFNFLWFYIGSIKECIYVCFSM